MISEGSCDTESNLKGKSNDCWKFCLATYINTICLIVMKINGPKNTFNFNYAKYNNFFFWGKLWPEQVFVRFIH